MAPTASLGIAVNSSHVEQATVALERLTVAARSAQTATISLAGGTIGRTTMPAA